MGLSGFPSLWCLTEFVKFGLKCINILNFGLDYFDPKTRWSSTLALVGLEQFDSGFERRVGFLGICLHSNCPLRIVSIVELSLGELDVSLNLTGLKIGGVLVWSD